jgi:hypothetical protein
VKRKEEDFVKHINKVVDEKAEIIDRQKQINEKRLENMKQELLSDQGQLAQNNPNIVIFLKEKERIKNELIQP